MNMKGEQETERKRKTNIIYIYFYLSNVIVCCLSNFVELCEIYFQQNNTLRNRNKSEAIERMNVEIIKHNNTIMAAQNQWRRTTQHTISDEIVWRERERDEESCSSRLSKWHATQYITMYTYIYGYVVVSSFFQLNAAKTTDTHKHMRTGQQIYVYMRIYMCVLCQR